MQLFLLPELEDDAVIHEAFRSVEKKAVIKALKAGKLWSHAFGIGGSTGRNGVPWFGDHRGITVNPWTAKARLIRPQEILKRIVCSNSSPPRAS